MKEKQRLEKINEKIKELRIEISKVFKDVSMLRKKAKSMPINKILQANSNSAYGLLYYNLEWSTRHPCRSQHIKLKLSDQDMKEMGKYYELVSQVYELFEEVRPKQAILDRLRREKSSIVNRLAQIKRNKAEEMRKRESPYELAKEVRELRKEIQRLNKSSRE